MKLNLVLLSAVISASVSATEVNDTFLKYVGNPDKVKELWISTYMASPRYPRRALKKNQVGCVLYSFTINEKGRAEQIAVLDSTAKGVFDNAGRSALKRYRWKPTEVNGSLTPVNSTIMLTFALPSKGISCRAEKT